MELEAAEVLILYAALDEVSSASPPRWLCTISESSLEDFNRFECGAKFEYCCCKSGLPLLPLLPISWSEVLVVLGEVDEEAETTAEYM